MKPHTSAQPTESTKLPPSRRWRARYACHKNKGDHTYELIKPDYVVITEFRQMSVDTYYERMEQREREAKERDRVTGRRSWCKPLYHYRCTACGHKLLEMQRRV